MDGEQLKLEIVFNHLLDRNFFIKDEQLEGLLKKVREEVTSQNVSPNTELYKKWILQIFKQRNVPSKTMIIFIVKFITEFNKKEANFLFLHQNSIFFKIITLLNVLRVHEDTKLMTVYLEMLTSSTRTEYGRNWLGSSLNSWKNVLGSKDDPEIRKELSQFICEVFINVVPRNELFAADFTQIIFAPFNNIIDLEEVEEISESKEKELYQSLKSTLNFLSEVFLRSRDCIVHISHWELYERLLKFRKLLNNILQNIKDDVFSLLLCKVLLPMYLLDIKRYRNDKDQYLTHSFNKINNLFLLNIRKEFEYNVLELSHYSHIYWHHIYTSEPLQILELPNNFQAEIMIMQLAPIGAIGIRYYGTELKTILKEDEVRGRHVDEIHEAIGKSSLERLMRFQILMNKKEDLLPLIQLVVRKIIKTLNLLNKDNIIIMFKYLIYLIKDIVAEICKNKSITSTVYNGHHLALFLKIFNEIIKKFTITWIEGIEIIGVVKIATDLLQVQDIPIQVQIKALQLMKYSVEKFMSADLVLLVDEKTSSVNQIGPILEQKLKHTENKIQCAALDALSSILEIAKIKYPYYREIILGANLNRAALEIALEKGEVEKRLLALKCLQLMAKILEIWEACATDKISESILHLLQTESNNILRAEVVNLISTIYEEELFTDEETATLYDIMAHLGIYDHDIHVRINALKFWDVVIKRHLQEEGMIDGQFPSVTFSKNSRKIVVLNEKEIIKRIGALMEKLSKIKCLSVLWHISASTVEEEKEFVHGIVSDLLEILDKHGVDSSNVAPYKSKKLCVRDSDSDSEGFEIKIMTPRSFLMNIMDMKVDSNRPAVLFSLLLDEILNKNQQFILI